MKHHSEEVFLLHDFLWEHGYSFAKFAKEYNHPPSTISYTIPQFYKTGAVPRWPRQRRIMRDLHALLERLRAEDEASEPATV